MKTTYVLSLDNDTALFIEQVRKQSGNEDPSVLINRLLRQERDRMGLPARQNNQQSGNYEMEQMINDEIPSAG
ncbi:hypothetical protein [Vampirovibrio chlorellavorus]|uniref:hypothetical protein n=1 Tax=Vampirovibrio chlorellavorus TaxID=758823 RepID=UPI0026E97181|nr:hypothetical protein [Vampirovibrio chlorellavorus]